MAQNLLEIYISIHHNGKIHLEHVLIDQPINFWLNFQALFLYCAFTYEKLKLIDYEYPLWAHIVGMCMGIVSTAFVPLYFLYSLIISPGNKVSEVKHFQKYSKWKAHYQFYFYSLQKYRNATMSVLPEFSDRKSHPPNQVEMIGIEDINA